MVETIAFRNNNNINSNSENRWIFSLSVGSHTINNSSRKKTMATWIKISIQHRDRPILFDRRFIFGKITFVCSSFFTAISRAFVCEFVVGHVFFIQFESSLGCNLYTFFLCLGFAKSSAGKGKMYFLLNNCIKFNDYLLEQITTKCAAIFVNWKSNLQAKLVKTNKIAHRAILFSIVWASIWFLCWFQKPKQTKSATKTKHKNAFDAARN